MEFNFQRLAVGLILALLFISPAHTLALKRDSRFAIHPNAYAYLDCSACVAFAGHLGNRINESFKFDPSASANAGTAPQHSDKENKAQRSRYASSEIRAAEVLEKICSDSLEDDYVLRLDLDRRIRVYLAGNSALPFAQFYSLQDSRAIKKTTKHAVRTFCERVMGEEEEAVTQLVLELRKLRDVQWRLCGGDESLNGEPPRDFTESITNACVGATTSIQLEIGRLERYEKWQNSLSEMRDGKKTEAPQEGKEATGSVPLSSESTESKPAVSKPAEDAKEDDIYLDDLDL